MTLNMNNYKGYEKKPYCNAYVIVKKTIHLYVHTFFGNLKSYKKCSYVFLIRVRYSNMNMIESKSPK